MVQHSTRIIDPLQVIPTPVTFFYLNHWVVLDNLLTMDFRRRRDCRDFARRGPLETTRRRSRGFGRWKSKRLIRWGERSSPLVTPCDHLGTKFLAKEGQIPVKVLRCHGGRESLHFYVEARVMDGLLDCGHLLRSLKLRDRPSHSGPCLV